MTLIERLEAADAGMVRDLLAEAFDLCFPPPFGASCPPAELIPELEAHTALCIRYREMLDAEAYTSAAEMLVPEGWPSRRYGTTDDGRGYAELATNDAHMMACDPDEWWVEADAATPALALASAALKARKDGHE